MITCKRDGRLVYHWPESIKQLKRAQSAAKRYGSGSKAQKNYEELHDKASRASGAWQLCACGSLCDAIPRDSHYNYPADLGDGVVSSQSPPQDEVLSNLGIDFCGEIGNRKYDKAMKTILAIEVRAGEVLSEIGKRKKNYGKPILK